MLIITKEDSYRAGALVRVLRETEARYYVEPVRNAAGRRTPGGGVSSRYEGSRRALRR